MKLCGLFERIQWCMALKSVNPYEQWFIVFDCHPCEERNELTLVFLMKLMGILSLLIPGSLILWAPSQMSYPGPVTRPKSVKVIGQACIGDIWRVHVCIWIFPVTSLVLSCLCANLKSGVEATALTSLRSTTTSQMTNYLGPVTRWNSVNVFGQRYIGKIWCVPMCAYGYFLSLALCYHVCVQIWNQKLKPLLSLHSEAPPLHRWRIILAQ
jgi:hypothetical protein